MKDFIKTLSNLSVTGFVNSLMLSIAGLIAATGIGLTALYLIKYVDNNAPEMKTLQCSLGIEREDCVDYQQKYDDLAQKRASLMQELAELKRTLKNLADIAENTDSITLFDTHDIPDTDFSVTVGTKYKDLLSSELTPTYFCYIDLGNGQLNEDRSLYIRNSSGDIDLDPAPLAKIGLDQKAIDFARTHCKPYIIARGGV